MCKKEEKRRLINKAAVSNRLKSRENNRKKEKDEGQYDEYCQADPRPFFHLCFNRSTLVFTKEGLAGAAKRVDTGRVGRLHQHQNNGSDCRNCHKGKQDIAYNGILRIILHCFGG